MKKRGKRLLVLTVVLTTLLLTGVVPFARASEEIVSISVAKNKSYYKVGDSVEGTGQVQVTGRRADGTEASLTGDSGLTYQFSNTSALIVSSAGQISAIAAGGGVLTVNYGELSAKMYLGAYTGTAQVDSGEGDYPATSDNVIKTNTVARSGQYAVQLKNGGRWPKYNDTYDSAVSETWFYDDGTSQDTFFAYFQSIENYTHRFMGVLCPEGQGQSGGIFDDLIYYTSGNNIPQSAPEARNLAIEGRPEAKFRLEAKYDYYDRNGDYEKPVAGTSVGASPIEWQVSDNGVDGWTTLSPAAQGNDSYVLTYNEMGKYVRFVVTPASFDQNYAVVNTVRKCFIRPSKLYW